MVRVVPNLYRALHQYGVSYVVGRQEADLVGTRIAPSELLVALAQCEADYLRHAIIALLFLHPEWADHALQICPPEATNELEVLVLATCYLQQRWYLQLGLALGAIPHVPSQRFARLWQQRGLPAPEVAFGECGLTELDAYERQRQGMILAYRDAWDSPVQHLLWQERHRREHFLTIEAIAPITLVPADGLPDKPKGLAVMDREQILRFVTQVAQRITAPDRLYVGSETMGVLCGLHATTETIDLHIGYGEVLSPAVETALRDMRSSPDTTWIADTTAYTIPLPSLWRERAYRLCSSGPLEVYGCDWAMVAVAKIARGTSWHLADVAALLTSGWISWQDIEQQVDDLLPRVRSTPAYRSLDLEVFQQIYQATTSLVSGTSVPRHAR